MFPPQGEVWTFVVWLWASLFTGQGQCSFGCDLAATIVVSARMHYRSYVARKRMCSLKGQTVYNKHVNAWHFFGRTTGEVSGERPAHVKGP